MKRRLGLALLFSVAIAGCATTAPETRNAASCGSMPPAFDAPILCPSVDKTARILEVRDETAYGFKIERAVETQGGLRIPPQTVTPFVRPPCEDKE